MSIATTIQTQQNNASTIPTKSINTTTSQSLYRYITTTSQTIKLTITTTSATELPKKEGTTSELVVISVLTTFALFCFIVIVGQWFSFFVSMLYYTVVFYSYFYFYTVHYVERRLLDDNNIIIFFMSSYFSSDHEKLFKFRKNVIFNNHIFY